MKLKITILSLILITILSLLAGRFNIFEADVNVMLVLRLRLIRIIIALLVGASLSLASLVFQSIFNNPLASTDILASSNGAAVGAVCAIALGLSSFSLFGLSFITSLMSLGLIFYISSFVKTNKNYGMILSGMLIGSICSSIISIVKLLADPNNVLPSITYWLMGSLTDVDINDLFLAIPLLLGIIFINVFKYKLSLLSLNETEALALGVEVKKTKIAFIIIACLLVSISVSLTGVIPWIGLVVPHLARIISPRSSKNLVILTTIIGAQFLLLVDTMSRSITSVEIPIGILVSFIGAPLFISLLKKEGRKI